MLALFPEFPITSSKNHRNKSRFQIEDIGMIFQRFPSQAKNKKTRKSRFQKKDIGIIFQRFPSQAQKNTEIPYSNRRYWHYFPEVPITNQKTQGNPIFK